MLNRKRCNSLKPDAVVIGAGPAGTLAAFELAKEGHNVQVFEDHEFVGEPVHCAGLLSTSGLSTLALKPPQSVIQNQVSGARIYSPNGSFIEIERGQREAHVIDRSLFDKWLAERAVSEGATITTMTKVTKVILRDDGVSGIRTADGDEVESSVIVNAEGSRCIISSSVGLPSVPRSSKLPAYQYELSGVDIDDTFVEMFYSRETAPGFFAWIIPLGNNRARVGLASRSKTKPRLKHFIRKNRLVKDRLEKATVTRGFGGTVLVGMPISRTWKDGLLVAGDAAGQVKATTGGGVIMGGLSARIAGQVASKALGESKWDFREYENRWQSHIMNELRAMYLVQKALTSLSDKGLDTLVESANRHGLVDIIRTEGDMDRQKRVIMSLTKNPRMLLLGLNVLRYLNPFIS